MAGSLSDLSKEAKAYWTNKQWAEYRNVRYETAEHVRGQDNWKRAAYLYVEVMIFDLQGVASGVAEGGFSRAWRGETPSVARELARFTLRENGHEGQLKVIYDQVVEEFWVDAFPRPQGEVWEEMKAVVQEYRKTIQLKEKVEALGPDRLLQPAEAESFAELADDYDLLQRVGTLLENVSPADIPWRKRKRVHEYLSAVDVKHIGKRWQGKAYRWAGEIVLSNGEKRAALEYFEKALEVADRDDRMEVKPLVKTLRREFDG